MPADTVADAQVRKRADGQSPGPNARWSPNLMSSITWQTLLIGVFVIVMNQVTDLKDRDIYQNYYASLDSCQWLECFLIADEVRSPIFLSLIIWGQRLGLDFDVVFTVISLLSVGLVTKALRDSGDPQAGTRLALVSITLGAWLYLIQVKLFLAVALYLFSKDRSRRWLRIALAVAAILTHESIIFFIALHYLWRPSELGFNFRSAIVMLVLVALLYVYLGTSSNVFVNSLQKIQHYNDLSAEGTVPAMSRLSLYSLLFLLFGLVGIFRLRPIHDGTVTSLQLKALLWMFLPWIVFMVFATNELYAIRLSELALLHTLLVVPLASDYRLPSRIGLLIFASTFGMLTFVRDVLLA